MQTVHVRAAVLSHLQHVDGALAQRVADGLGMDALPAAAKAAAPVREFASSPALQIIGKMKDTLKGRCIGILVADGSDAKLIASLRLAAENAGAKVKIVAPKVGGAVLADGKHLAADGQLAGTPSVLFDAVAVILSADGAAKLAKEASAVDFVRDAFGHLKGIAIDAGGKKLLSAAGIVADAGVVDATNTAGFIAAAKTRQWPREASVRTLP